MSNATYSTYWNESNELYKDLLAYEKPPDFNLQVKDRSTAFQHYAVLYIKYISLYRKLQVTYDQTLHPQKRPLLKDMLVASVGRLIEVKQILVEMECSDVFNLSEVLLDLKLTHDALQVPVPKFISEVNSNTESGRLVSTSSAKEFKAGRPNILLPTFTLEEAIKIIQTNERGRQGKLRARYITDLQAEAQQDKKLLLANPGDREKAAMLLQRVYRGYLARKLAKVMRNEQMIFLGMANPATTPKSSDEYTRRKRLQKQFEVDYLESLVTTKEKLLKTDGPDIKEAIQDDFRQWYMEHKRVSGKFPDFPTEQVWKAPDFKFSAPAVTNQEARVSGKVSKGTSKPNTPKPSTPKPATPKGKKDEENDSLNKFKSLGDSEFLEMGSKQIQKFESEWKEVDETDNFAQRHDQAIIKNAKRKEVEAEIKQEVFVLLEEELQNLKLAVEKDGKKKGKAAKAKKSKPKKDKKAAKKGKKDKDLTSDRTMESLVEELIQTGIMQKYSPCYFDSWIGNYNLTEPLITKDVFITPSIAEVQRALVEYGALPLGITFTEDGLPKPEYNKVASILLHGPSGTGKSKLVQSLATELGATLFDLSPKNTQGQYEGKQSVTKMVHMVFKVAKANSPAIVYIEGVEMIFAKKVPKDDTSDPKRIKKDLGKALNLIRDHACKVIVIGVSSKPWDGDAKAMLPLFDKVLHCPKPDHSSRYLIWKNMVERKTVGLSRSLDYSLLTRSSDNLSTGVIEMVVERVLTERRLQKPQNLSSDEFLKHINALPASTRDLEEISMFKEFNERASSKRQTLLEGPSDEEIAKTAKKNK